MTGLQSYYLLGSALAAGREERPAHLFAGVVDGAISGFIPHAVYLQRARLAEQAWPGEVELERRLAWLVRHDANPLAELMLTAPADSDLQRRWNGFDASAALGTSTRLQAEGLRRRALAEDDCASLRADVAACCVAQLRPCAAGPARSDHPRRLRQVQQELGLPSRALGDGLDCLYANPELDLPGCAAALATSPRCLQREFSRLGTSFSRLRQAVRLGLAGHLLRQSRLDLTGVALCAGFFDAAHFAHAWRAACGLSPSQYQALL